MLQDYLCPKCEGPIVIRNIGTKLEAFCPKCKFTHRLNITFPSEPAKIHDAWKEERKQYIKED